MSEEPQRSCRKPDGSLDLDYIFDPDRAEMSISMLAYRLRQLNITVEPTQGTTVRITSPKGVMTHALREAICEHKWALIELYREQAVKDVIRPEDLNPSAYTRWQKLSAYTEYVGGQHREHAEAEALWAMVQEGSAHRKGET